MNYDIVMLQKTKESPECGHGNSNTRNTQVITFFRKVIDNIIGSNASTLYHVYRELQLSETFWSRVPLLALPALKDVKNPCNNLRIVPLKGHTDLFPHIVYENL